MQTQVHITPDLYAKQYTHHNDIKTNWYWKKEASTGINNEVYPLIWVRSAPLGVSEQTYSKLSGDRLHKWKWNLEEFSKLALRLGSTTFLSTCDEWNCILMILSGNFWEKIIWCHGGGPYDTLAPPYRLMGGAMAPWPPPGYAPGSTNICIDMKKLSRGGGAVFKFY